MSKQTSFWVRSVLLGSMLLVLFCAKAWADVPGAKVKIGVLSDFSGPFADQVGKGSFVAAQMAAEDFAAEAGGLEVEVVFADHQNKPDVGVAIARRWLDQAGVSAIVDLANSGVARAVSGCWTVSRRVIGRRSLSWPLCVAMA